MEAHRIRIDCPVCNTWSNITVDMPESPSSIIPIMIENGTICEHRFECYVDQNFVVRDAIPVYKVITPVMRQNFLYKKCEFPLHFKINLISFKINIYANIIAYLIKAVFSRKTLSIVMRKKAFLIPSLQYFIDFIFKDSFFYSIKLSEKLYRTRKEDIIIDLDNLSVVKDDENVLRKRALKFEVFLANSFYYENEEPLRAMLILQKEIQKVYSIAKSIEEFITVLKNKKIDILDIIQIIAKKEGIDIKDKIYIDYLVKIVEDYFLIEKLKICSNLGSII